MKDSDTYTVQAGDTLSAIAEKLGLGAENWRELVEYNRQYNQAYQARREGSAARKDAAFIMAGETLHIPPQETQEHATQETQTVASDASTTHDTPLPPDRNPLFHPTPEQSALAKRLASVPPLPQLAPPRELLQGEHPTASLRPDTLSSEQQADAATQPVVVTGPGHGLYRDDSGDVRYDPGAVVQAVMDQRPDGSWRVHKVFNGDDASRDAQAFRKNEHPDAQVVAVHEYHLANYASRKQIAAFRHQGYEVRTMASYNPKIAYDKLADFSLMVDENTPGATVHEHRFDSAIALAQQAAQEGRSVIFMPTHVNNYHIADAEGASGQRLYVRPGALQSGSLSDRLVGRLADSLGIPSQEIDSVENILAVEHPQIAGMVNELGFMSNTQELASLINTGQLWHRTEQLAAALPKAAAQAGAYTQLAGLSKPSAAAGPKKPVKNDIDQEVEISGGEEVSPAEPVVPFDQRTNGPRISTKCGTMCQAMISAM